MEKYCPLILLKFRSSIIYFCILFPAYIEKLTFLISCFNAVCLNLVKPIECGSTMKLKIVS